MSILFFQRRRKSVVRGADSFDRANSATLGTSSTGGVWVDLAAGFGITSNQAVSSAINAKAVLTLTSANAWFEVTVVTNIASTWVLFRAIDAANYFRFGSSTVSGALTLLSVVAGAATSLVTTGTNMAAGQRWRVVTSGDNITISVDGVQVAAITSTTFNTNTKFGFQANTGTAFDDWYSRV